jgi:hypothetical protein
MVAMIVAALGFIWWLIFIVAWVLFLFFTITVARMKGRSALVWGILACFLPLITVIVLLLLPDRSSD